MKDELGKALLAKHNTLAQGHVASFLSGGVEDAVEAAPGPEKTAASKGRTRGSIKPSTGQPNVADPGLRNSYSIPNDRDAKDATKRWNPYDSAYISVGTDYYKYIRKKYPIIETSARSAQERLEQDQGSTVRRADSAG